MLRQIPDRTYRNGHHASAESSGGCLRGVHFGRDDAPTPTAGLPSKAEKRPGLPRCATYSPFRDQRTLLGPISPTGIDTGACRRQQVDLACNGEQGPARPRSILRYGERHRSVQSSSPSLRSVSGPAGPLVGLFKSSSAAFQIEMGQVEARQERGAKIDRATVTSPMRPTPPTGPASI